MHRLPLETQTLYAELLERLVAFEAHRAIGSAPGSFVTKQVKGAEYYYFQYSQPGGSKRQAYVGRRDEVLDSFVERYKEARETTVAERESAERMVSLLRAGGAMMTDSSSARVLHALAEAGVFHSGAVLVGTHAHVAIGNMLGVVWDSALLRTQDIDVAAERNVAVAVPGPGKMSVPDVLEGLEMGFLPVPALDRKAPSTSFNVRGQGLRLDILTPARGAPNDAPVAIPWLGSSAQPVRFLEYVIERPVRVAIVAGGGVLVNVPDPARYALHKLLVSARRPVAMHAKREKDLRQAAQVLEVLVEERVADVRSAWEDLASRGSGWTKPVRAGFEALASLAPEVAARVSALT